MKLVENIKDKIDNFNIDSNTLEKLLNAYFLSNGYNKEDIVCGHFGSTYVRNKDLWAAGYNARNEQIQKRIEELTDEIKSITDGSMASGQKLIKLRGQKKELKNLIV